MRTLLTLMLSVFLGAVIAAGQAPDRPGALELARMLQQKYDAVRDFSADFMHTYEGGVLRRQTTERGEVYIKKPGQMRWEYEKPEEKLFVSDGVKVYSYLPADRQVIVGTMPAADEASTPVLFLVGKGSLPRDFTVRYGELPGAGDDTYVLELTPRRPEPEYTTLFLAVDRETLELRRLVSVDRQGGTSTFVFSNLQENRGLSDKLFRFTIPRNVEVVTDASASPP